MGAMGQDRGVLRKLPDESSRQIYKSQLKIKTHEHKAVRHLRDQPPHPSPVKHLIIKVDIVLTQPICILKRIIVAECQRIQLLIAFHPHRLHRMVHVNPKRDQLTRQVPLPIFGGKRHVKPGIFSRTHPLKMPLEFRQKHSFAKDCLLKPAACHRNQPPVNRTLAVINHLGTGACSLVTNLEAQERTLEKLLRHRISRELLAHQIHTIQSRPIFLKGKIYACQQTGSLGLVCQDTPVFSDECGPVKQVSFSAHIFGKVITVQSPDQTDASDFVRRHGIGLVISAYAQVSGSGAPKRAHTVS